MRISIPLNHIRSLLKLRKMVLRDLDFVTYIENENAVYIDSEQDLERLCKVLSMPLATILAENDESDLDAGVKIARKGEGYCRRADSNGLPSYQYRHILTTNSDPYLTTLRTSPLYSEDIDPPLNEGHLSKEFVYVLRGEVILHWQKSEGIRRREKMLVGDSVYLEPYVKHAFSKVSLDAEILVVDFR